MSTDGYQPKCKPPKEKRTMTRRTMPTPQEFSIWGEELSVMPEVGTECDGALFGHEGQKVVCCAAAADLPHPSEGWPSWRADFKVLGPTTTLAAQRVCEAIDAFGKAMVDDLQAS